MNPDVWQSSHLLPDDDPKSREYVGRMLDRQLAEALVPKIREHGLLLVGPFEDFERKESFGGDPSLTRLVRRLRVEPFDESKVVFPFIGGPVHGKSLFTTGELVWSIPIYHPAYFIDPKDEPKPSEKAVYVRDGRAYVFERFE